MIGTFIQTYGYWILIGVAVIFMMRMHGGGMHNHGGGGSSAGHDAHTTHTTDAPEPVEAGAQPPAPVTARPAASEAEGQPR